MIFSIALAFTVFLFFVVLYGSSTLTNNPKFLRAIKNTFREDRKYELLIPIFTLALFLLIAFSLSALFIYIIQQFAPDWKNKEEIILTPKVYEGLIITFSTFLILLFLKARYQTKTIIDSKHWTKYETSLRNATKEIKAISVAPVNMWFQPIAFRYLVKQLEHVKLKDQHRILMIDDKKDDFGESWAFESLNPVMHSLTEEQRKFRNLVDLQRNAGIELYFITSKQVKDFLKNEKINNNLSKTYKLKDIDRLLIDEVCYYPHPSKKKYHELCFDEETNPEIKSLVNKICTTFMQPEYSYSNYI